MIIEDAFIATASVGLLTLLLNVLGAALYDVHEVKKQRRFNRHPYARQHRQRPLVSVIVTAHDDGAVIEDCLRGLAASSYRKQEIVVIDNASDDNTRQLVRRFQAEHPKQSIRLVARRSPGINRRVAAANAKKHARGDLILWLDAGSMIDSQAIARAVRQFNLESGLDGLILNRQIEASFSTVGLFQQYQELLSQGPRKLSSMSGLTSEAPEKATMYRREALSSLGQSGSRSRPALRWGYAADALVYSWALPTFQNLVRQQYRRQSAGLRLLWEQRQLLFGRNSYRQLLGRMELLLKLCSALVSLFVPVLISYFIYMAVSLHEPAFLVLSGGLVAMLVLFAVWGNEHLQITQKVIYTLGIPLTYSVFYILSFVQIFATLTAALRPRKAVG